MIYALIIVYILINVCFCLYEFSKRYISAGLIVSVGQLLMFCGIAKLASFDVKADVILIGLYLLGYLFFISFYIILCRDYDVSSIPFNTKDKISLYQYRILYCMIIGSTLISIAFFALSGVNIIQTMISAIVTRSSTDISQLRKAITFTRGSGAVYQLRNFVLPLSVMFFVIFEKGKKRYFGIIFLPITILLLIGSGQRAGLVFLILISIVSVLFSVKIGKNYVNTDVSLARTAKKRKKRIYIITALLVIAFAMLTVLNGRDQVSGSLVKAVQDRFLNDNQACAILGFRYIYNRDITYGADWFNMFIDLFRENQYTPVSALIHAQLYGSLEGTAPPCIWGSAYYNFGVFGIVLNALFLAFMSKTLYAGLCRKENNSLRLLMYGALFVLFGTWVADSPIMLLNGGFLVVIFMILLLFPRIKITK